MLASVTCETNSWTKNRYKLMKLLDCIVPKLANLAVVKVFSIYASP
jgi:hypothetical protein